MAGRATWSGTAGAVPGHVAWDGRPCPLSREDSCRPGTIGLGRPAARDTVRLCTPRACRARRTEPSFGSTWTVCLFLWVRFGSGDQQYPGPGSQLARAGGDSRPTILLRVPLGKFLFSAQKSGSPGPGPGPGIVQWRFGVGAGTPGSRPGLPRFEIKPTTGSVARFGQVCWCAASWPGPGGPGRWAGPGIMVCRSCAVSLPTASTALRGSVWLSPKVLDR